MRILPDTFLAQKSEKILSFPGVISPKGKKNVMWSWFRPLSAEKNENNTKKS